MLLQLVRCQLALVQTAMALLTLREVLAVELGNMQATQAQAHTLELEAPPSPDQPQIKSMGHRLKWVDPITRSITKQPCGGCKAVA
jgi:hypothetical protein